jgi:hypothetical protein
MNITADLSQLAEAIERIRQEVLAPGSIARATGHPVSTISRDRAEKPLIDWKTRDILLLARACPEITEALLAFLQLVPQTIGQAHQVQADLSRDVRATGLVDQRIRDGLCDGRLTAREIDEIRAALAMRRTSDAELDRDLRAARRTAAP